MPAMPAALSAALFPRKHARHARSSAAAPALLAGGLTAALAVADASVVTSSASAGGSVAQFERLAQCESGGNWSINTGNGYYGGIQFNLATWRGLGRSGYPHQASKAEQIAAGQKLHSQRGWKPWPACSRKLGLSGNGGYSGSGEVAAAGAPAEEQARASRSRRAAAAPRLAGVRYTVGTPPPFPGTLSVRDVSRYRPAVAQWQRRMATRGWRITVDGRFGPQSARIATEFAAGKRIPAARGTVDRAVWNAAWNTPVGRA